MNLPEQGATAVISHQVREDRLPEYEIWLQDISQAAKKSSGLMDWQIVRPIPGFTSTYTVLLRFDSVPDLEKWMKSQLRKDYIEKAKPLLLQGDDYYTGEGLDFLFTQASSKTVAPKRWKQFLVTWSAIFPLSLFVPLLVIPFLRFLNISGLRAIDGFFVSGVIVSLMVFIVMPRYTRLVHNWLKA